MAKKKAKRKAVKRGEAKAKKRIAPEVVFKTFRLVPHRDIAVFVEVIFVAGLAIFDDSAMLRFSADAQARMEAQLDAKIGEVLDADEVEETVIA